MVLLPYGFLLEDNEEGKNEQTEVVLLPYGFLLEDNASNNLVIRYYVLLPYGFLLEDNLECDVHYLEMCFATIWIFARR